MLVTVMLIVATLVAILLLALLWRRECRRHGVAVKPYVFWFPALVGLAGVMVFVGYGMSSGTLRLLHDVHQYRPQAQQLIQGAPLSSLNDEAIPFWGITNALQAALRETPSVAGWQSLSKLYWRLAQQEQQAAVNASGKDAATSRQVAIRRAQEAGKMSLKAAQFALAMRPDDAKAKLFLAQRHIDVNDGQLNASAHKLIRDVLAAHPNYDGAWLLLAMGAIHAKRYDLAEEAFAALLSHHPDDKATDVLKQSLQKARQQAKTQQYYANLTVTVVADKAASLTTGGTLFVFLQRKGGAGQPLAAKRVLLTQLPMTVTLKQSNWLQDMPAVGTPLIVGGRYSGGPAATVASSQPLKAVPLRKGNGGLVATLSMTPDKK